MTIPTNKPSSAAADAFQPGQNKGAGFVPAYASATPEAERQERLTIIQRIPENAGAALKRLTTTNYQVDRTIREAILARPDQWQEASEMLVFTSSDQLKVYLGTPRDPLDMPEACSRIRELHASTVLTARIVLGLWNSRRSNPQLAKDGSIAMRLEEVLEWRELKKHSYLASPGSSTQRYTDGYEARHKEQVLKDLDLLASCCFSGRVSCTFKGKKVQVSITGPYLRYSLVTQKTRWAQDAVAGVFVSPGAWVNSYTEYDNYFLAEVDRAIFHLHPHQQQHELRLALYLTERWRQLAREGMFEKEISMSELLFASMIRVDKTHLTSQFAPRIEQALHVLWERNLLGGGEPKPLEPVDKSQGQWGKAWLTSRWILPPPPEIRGFYATTLTLSPSQSLSRRTPSSRKPAAALLGQPSNPHDDRETTTW